MENDTDSNPHLDFRIVSSLMRAGIKEFADQAYRHIGAGLIRLRIPTERATGTACVTLKFSPYVTILTKKPDLWRTLLFSMRNVPTGRINHQIRAHKHVEFRFHVTYEVLMIIFGICMV